VNYQDGKNYYLFGMESKSVSRTLIRDGKKSSTVKVPHSFEKQSTYSVQIVITEASITHKIYDGKNWVKLDELQLPGTTAPGKFGFYIPGKDQVGLSHFSFSFRPLYIRPL
jgi:hypothetical protein